MIIKVYTNKFPTEMFILEDCSDIRIDTNIHKFGYVGIDTPSSVYSYDGEGTDMANCGRSIKSTPELSVGTCHVDFTRKGVRSRLLVSNYAYVCNDQGKTIEKVSVR